MKKGSLRLRLLILFSGMTAVLICITSSVSYLQLRSVANEVSISTMNNYLIQTLNSLDIFLGDVENTAKNIIATEEVQKALREIKNTSGLEALTRYRSLQNTYQLYTNTRTYIQKVYLLNTDYLFLDRDYYNDNTLIHSAWFDSLNIEAETHSFSTLHSITYPVKAMVFTYQHPIYSTTYPRELIGWVMMDIDATLLDNVFIQDLPFDGGQLQLYNANGVSMYRQQDDARYTLTNDTLQKLAASGENARMEYQGEMLLSAISKISNWQLVMTVPMTVLMRGVSTYLPPLLLASLLTIAIFIAAASLCIHHAFRPLMNVTEAMDAVSSGDFSIQLPLCGQSETRRLISGFNSMVAHICQLVDKVSLEERRKKDMEIQALRAQVSPHFLYNTLNSIRYLARVDRSADVQTAISALIHLLQASFERTRFITIAREMQLVRDYMKIQKLRYDLPLEVVENLDPQAMNCLIPGFTIQPIVENSLFHGIVPNQGGSIAVTVCVKGAFIEIAIEDNGVGIPPEKVAQLLHGTEDNPKFFTSIGIANVDARIRYFTMDMLKLDHISCAQGLTIESTVGKGSCVKMRIPMIKAEVRENEPSESTSS